MNKYKCNNIGSTFNSFVAVYHTKGNMNLIAESFQRSLLIKDLKNWLINNHKYFKTNKAVLQNKQIEHVPTNEDEIINNT
jgi:hypothetical protein